MKAGAQDTAPFVTDAALGCHVADARSLPLPSWLLGLERYRKRDFPRGARLPDLALDRRTGRLTCVNTSAAVRVFYVSTHLACIGADGLRLTQGCWRREGALESEPCTTFVLLLPPSTLLHVANLQRTTANPEADVQSDVQEWTPHPSPALLSPHSERGFCFPLRCQAGQSFLCTQAEGGSFTHFFASTHHSFDFRCAVGTPVLALAAGTVAKVMSGHSCSGVHVSNLFHWNGVLIKHAGGVCSEYVHLSVVSIAAGDAVAAGQVVGLSGDIGFAPEPHLHVTVLETEDDDASTLRFGFCRSGGAVFYPVAGRCYDSEGETAALHE